MRKILYDKQEGKMNEEVARRLHDEMRGDIKGDVQHDKREELQDVDGQECGSATQRGMEDLVQKLEELCEDMAVVKGYILALQKPLMDRCNTWIDGSMVMEVLKIGAKTLKAFRENGMMPYSKTGGRYYYRAEDMDDLLRKNYSKGIKPGGADE